MGFGGSVQAMLTSLKNNARRKRENYFDKKEGTLSERKKELDNLLNRKATPSQIHTIRRRMEAEREEQLKRNIVLLVFII